MYVYTCISGSSLSQQAARMVWHLLPILTHCCWPHNLCDIPSGGLSSARNQESSYSNLSKRSEATAKIWAEAISLYELTALSTPCRRWIPSHSNHALHRSPGKEKLFSKMTLLSFLSPVKWYSYNIPNKVRPTYIRGSRAEGMHLAFILGSFSHSTSLPSLTEHSVKYRTYSAKTLVHKHLGRDEQ